MTGQPELRTRTRLLALGIGLSLLVTPVLADEALEEDFLLFLSEWGDESGAFLAPTEMEPLLEGEDQKESAAEVSEPEGVRGAAEGGSDEQI